MTAVLQCRSLIEAPSEQTGKIIMGGGALCLWLMCLGLCINVVTPAPYVLEWLTSTFTKPEDDDKVWLFAIDGRRKPFQFVNDIGEIEGFNVDVIGDVCREARKKCKMVLSPFTECTFTDRNINYPGRGLMAGWFDACPGYAITVDRLSAFDFTLPFVGNGATFSVLPGNPSAFDPDLSDYSGFVITHLTGAFTNAACLRRLKKTFNKIVVAANLPEAKQLLLNNTAQVLFSPRSAIPDLEVLPQRVSCSEGGGGIMVKKGSPLPFWWNQAFREYYASGRFHALCQRDGEKYNRTIDCL